MKIALVVSHPIQHFCPQYESFAKIDGVEFKVFFASALGYKKYFDKNFQREVSWANVNLHGFNHTFLNGDVALPSDKNLDTPSLDGELASFKPHLLIVYGYFQKFQRRAHRWASGNEVPIAYISDSELRQKRSSWKQLLKYFFLKRYFSSISYFLSVGDANEQFYKYYGVSEDRIVRMHFPIDVVFYRKAFQDRDILRKAVREKYNISENEIVLAVVGKLVPWKNQDHIIQAMQVLEDKGNIFKLLVIGSGEKQEEWARYAKSLKTSQAIFVGFVPPEQLPSYYAACDIYVHPASIEPHSIAISEAIYMGCPIIVSDRSGSHGPNDDVQEGANGFVYPFGDINALANAIKNLAENKERRSMLGKYSHEIAERFQNKAHRGVIDELREGFVMKGRS
jgi:glycosyltransferase involved in cell wall biosynthesis